jgi:hypothetical protein
VAVHPAQVAALAATPARRHRVRKLSRSG